MTIVPIVHSVTVKVPPTRAFELFAAQMGRWWPQGRTIGAGPHAEITVEPRSGGRWFETDAEGRETQWGRVLAWEPPSRLLLDWQINQPAGGGFRFDPTVSTEVEVTFAPAGDGTLVRLEHRRLEGLGADADRLAPALDGGWSGQMANFVRYADAATAREG